MVESAVWFDQRGQRWGCWESTLDVEQQRPTGESGGARRR